MKNILPGLALFFLLTSANLFAQKTISEGTFTYTIDLQMPENKPAASNPLNGATNTVYVKGAFSRVDMVSNLGTEKTIHDSKTGSAVILKEYSGQKLMITLTKENWVEKNRLAEGIRFTDQGEQKEILGYTCQKATATLSDGSVLTVYYTRELSLQNSDYNPLFKNLPGLPLQYEVDSKKNKFIYTISKIDLNSISPAKFEYPKAGYRVITYDENKQGKK